MLCYNGLTMLKRYLIWPLMGLVTVACALSPLLPTPTPRPTATPRPPTPVPTHTLWPTATPLPPDTGWQRVQPGIEVRSLNVPAGDEVERATIARLDPGYVRFRVLYTSGVAYPVSVWARQTGALLVVNGGYFTEGHTVTGLTVSDGVVYGSAYGDYAGMFAVTYDERATVRWLRTWAYDPAEPLRDAVQSFPVVVKPGGVMGFPADGDDGRLSRRTVVAQDRQGRILLLITPRGYLSLHALAVWLAGSDLEIDVALNLDGGTSSGFWMRADAPTPVAQVDSMVPVPAVIAIFPSE